MAERTSPSVNFDLPPTTERSILGLRLACGSLCGFVAPGNREEPDRVPRARILHEEDQDQEFHYGNTRCLSRYYSVFVARLAIMVMLAILIGMLTILTWHFTRVYTRKSINSLAYGLRFELLQRPILRMWNILNSTAEVTVAQVKLSEYVIGRYAKPTTHRQPVELYEVMRDVTWALFTSRKALTAITINYRNGYVQAFHRDHRSNSTFYIYSVLASSSHSNTQESEALESHGWHNRSMSGNASAIWYQEQLDPVTGKTTGIQRQIPPENLINIAGISEIHDGAASWHVAVSKFTDSPLLSAALPVRHPSEGSIMAVVGVTAALYSVGQLMRELVEFHSGYMYLTSREGYVLATSTDAPLLTNSTGGPKLMMAVDSKDPIIRLAAEWLQKTYGDKLSLNHELHVENVMLRHQKYYLDSFFLNLKRLPMVGVIVMPRKCIMGRIDQRAFTTLVILISASVCILAIGCVCILILTSGVSKEMKLRAELISHLDARRRAEASSNCKSQFLANMSHELRTPLAAVIGLLDILICDDYLTNEQSATVSQIRKCSTALLRLLNNILDLSKVESGKLVLEEAEFDLGRELEGLVDMFSVQCIDHNVEIFLDLSDDMPKLVQGDSARVVQIFANLISNSIKFTSSGHIILRGWCEWSNACNNTDNMPPDNNEPRAAQKMKLQQTGNLGKRAFQKDNRITLWFEVEDTGCGIDPSKWESVFESFEQADPSTTRMYGGTGLGLCIVHTLVKGCIIGEIPVRSFQREGNHSRKWPDGQVMAGKQKKVKKMGGEIKVVKKEGPGTLMHLYLVFSIRADGPGKRHQIEFRKKSLMVLLAVNGSKGRFIMSQWLRGEGVHTCEASEWNDLTQILRKVFQPSGIEDRTKFLPNDLNFLEKYHRKAKFAWVLNHDTANAIKMELRKKGHLLMVNRPLYKSKLNQILEAAIGEIKLENEREGNSLECSTSQLGSNECFEINPVHFNAGSFDDSDTSDTGSCTLSGREFLVGETQKRNCRSSVPSDDLGVNDNSKEGNCFASSRVGSSDKTLEGLCILLAEDTPVLQRVATTMLEKMGATVVSVGDGLQVVDALKCFNAEGCKRDSSMNHDGEARSRQFKELPPFDLILMDCQMPKLDGYEATKTIRRSEAGTRSHIPIVALTAHAMSSDEAKCLKVGMDAYLTKPIDCRQMVSTILSLTKRKV